MQSYSGHYTGRHTPFAANGNDLARKVSRSIRSNAVPPDMRCVRIEHNADSSITFSFSEEPDASNLPLPEAHSSVADQGLHVELNAVSELARTREALNAIQSSSTGEAQLARPVGVGAFPRQKALTFALVPARERHQYSEAAGPGDLRHLDECLRATKTYTGPLLPGPAQPITREDSDIEYASDEDVRTMERHWSAEENDELAQFSGRNPPPLSEWRGSRRARAAAAVLEGMDETNEDCLVLMDKFSNLCHGGQLDAGLVALSRFVVADRTDVLQRFLQRHFLKKAAEQAGQAPTKSSMPVRQAIKFVQILPRKYATLSTYNMVLSVCVRARDLAAARQVVDMLRSTGQKPDGIIFTSLITACAAVGDAESAFAIRDEMLSEGHAINLKAATSLINACSRQIMNTNPSNRRDRLVLLEQAHGVLQSFVGSTEKCDEALWNAFLTCAGRAAQLQRALKTLDNMREKNMQRGAATYGALIDACVRNNEKKLALSTYHKALDAGFIENVFIYTSAMAACINDKDKETALQIFQQSRRNGVKADDKMHAVLMAAVGGCCLEEATTLRQELAETGIMRPQAGASSLIDASLRNNDLQTAKSLLAEAQSGRQKLSTNTVNSLLNSLAKTAEIAEIVQIVIKLTQQGFVPDKYTYTALLAACNYADAGELAFTVWRLMDHHKIQMDEAICFTLLRTCYNQIRISHAPYEPGEEKKAEAEEKLGEELVRALEGSTRMAPLTSQEKRLPWGARAMTAYRKLTSVGVQPKIHVLERLVGCFRLWALPEPVPTNPSFGTPLKLRAFLKSDGRKATLPAHSVDGIYDDRAFSVLEEAVAEGLLPSLKPSNGVLIIDLTRVLPFTSEVYILEMLAHFLESDDKRRRDLNKIVFKTTPYWRPDDSSSPATPRHKRVDRSMQSETSKYSATFPAIKALLSKLGFRFNANAETGSIVISPERLLRWKALVEKAASAWEISSMNSLQKAVRLRDSLHYQTMNIRNGVRTDSIPAGRRGLKRPNNLSPQ